MMDGKMTDKETKRARMEIRKRRRLRILAVILSFCVLFTSSPGIWEAVSVFAAEESDGEDAENSGGGVETPGNSENGDDGADQGTDGEDIESDDGEDVSGGNEPGGGEDDGEKEPDGKDKESGDGSDEEESDGEEIGGDKELDNDDHSPEEEPDDSEGGESVDEQNGSDDIAVQELLARIAALPEAEELLAKEPEAEDEEAYEEWMAELSMYGEEAFAILEAYEDLTEEQQAQIPGEAVAKLMAWVELAETVGERVQVMAAAHIHDGGVTFDKVLAAAGGELESGNYYLTGNTALENIITIPSGVEVNLCLNGYTLNGPGEKAAITLHGTLNVYDCSGGGVLSGDSVGGTAAIAISLTESSGIFNLYGGKITGGATTVISETKKGNVLNLFGGIVEGSNTKNGSYPINNWGTVLISGDAVVSGAGAGSYSCAVMNNDADAVLTVKDNASLSDAGHGVRNKGTVNIEGGTLSGAGDGVNNEGTVNIKGGTITGEKYGVNMATSTATLNLSGSPTVSGKTADLYLKTATGVALGNAKVDAGGYTGGKLTVKEMSASVGAGSYAIRTGEGNKDKFTLTNSGWRYLYKDGGLVLDQHTHSCTYAADGNVITESCSCGHEETATLSLQSGADLTYTGSAVTPVSVTYSGGWAGTGTNKPNNNNIVYTDNTNVGTAKAELTIGGATAAVDFQITEGDMTADVTVSDYIGTYDGDKHGITVSAPAGASIEYGINTNYGFSKGMMMYDYVGDHTVYYRVTKTYYKPVAGIAKVKINPRSISDAAVTLDGAELTYNGSEQTKGIGSVTVTVGAKTLKLSEGRDYTVSGNVKTDAGTHTITISAKKSRNCNYTGTKTVTFTIAPKPLAAGMVSVASGPHYYTGSAVTPAVTVKDGDRPLTKDTDYTVGYEDNTNAGTATVTVTGKGNYTGTVSQTFTIQYGPLPTGKKLADYVTVSPAPTEGWYGAEITLTPKGGCGVGETPSDIGGAGVTVSDETGADGETRTIYIKDENGNIYQTTFSYKLDKTSPVIDLSNMSVTNGKGLWNWIVGKKSMIIRIPEADITDALSGIKEVTYTATPEKGAQQTQTMQVKDGSYEISLNAEFSGTIKLTAKDKSDNVKEVSLTAEGGKVIAEDYAPVVTITLPDTLGPNEKGWYNTAVSVGVTVSDDKDNSDTAVISGGIAEIKWKDGENGAEQTVPGLPGTSPVYTKKFTISVNTDGVHTYYVKTVDNAGNESGWQTVTVRLDTGSPEFSQDVSVTNRTQEGADITFTPSEGGKAYWIVSDTGTAPDAQAVVTGAQEDAGKGGVRDIAGSTPDTFTVTGLIPGAKHTVYMVLEDVAGNLSAVKEVSFTTLQKAPEMVLGDLVIDHGKETVKIPDGIGEVEVYTDPDNPSGSRITPDVTDRSIPVEPGTTIYIRYPQKEQDGETTPASDSVAIVIPGRPAAPAPKQVTVTDTTVTVIGSSAGEEYLLVEKGSRPAGAEPDWNDADKVNDTGVFTGLDPHKAYDLYVRKKAAGDDFASASAKIEVRTHVTIDEPEITGDGAGKSGNTAPRPAKPDEGGATVTYTGTYEEDYTPVIKVGGKEIVPGAGTSGAESSEMNWDEEGGKGEWKYVYPVPDAAVEADITVEFRKRTVTGIAAKPERLSIHADHDANRAAAEAGSISPLTAYLKETCSVRTVYDNGTKETLQETTAFTTADNFVQKGAVYRYTVSAGEKTCTAVLTVEPVAASVRNPNALTKTRKNGGYTAQEVGAWLPAQVTVAYTGTGYTERTESLAVTWDTSSVGEDFGQTLGEETINGTAKLPAWATGEDTVSIVIRFENKKPSSGGGDSSGHNGGNGADGNNGDGGSSDGNNRNTPEKGAHPGAPAVTPPPAAAPQPPTRIGSLKQPQPSDMEDSRPEEEQEPESPGTSEPTEKPSEKDQAQQSEEDGEQTIPAAVENGKIVISGESVATGNVKGMTDKRTVLRLEKGAVIVTVVCAEQEYTAGVADTIAIANAVLAPEQIELIHNGETIEIRIDVKDISEKVPAQDKKAIESGIEAYQKEVTGLVLGMYVDISMFIKIGAGDWNAVTETDQPVEMVIGIPETLQSDGREFYIIRAHNGEYAFMNDLDDAPDTITVSTDRFSSYAIAYVETEGAGGGSGAKCGLCHICPTFLGVCCFIWLAIIITAVIIAIIVILRRNEQAAHEADSDI